MTPLGMSAIFSWDVEEGFDVGAEVGVRRA